MSVQWSDLRWRFQHLHHEASHQIILRLEHALVLKSPGERADAVAGLAAAAFSA
jgi:hypothetical protein